MRPKMTLSKDHWRIQPVGLGGAAWSDLTNLTYPQILVCPRISATFFKKIHTNKNKSLFFFRKNRYSDHYNAFQLNGYLL